MQDEELIAAIRAGDRTASNRLARRYYPHLYTYFSSRLSGDEAQDLTQLTLLHTVARVDRYRAESSFRQYVFGVARRVLSERYRRDQRRIETEEPGSEPPASQTSPSQRVFKAQFHARLVQALATLSEHYRVVVDLHLRGADNFEIAEALGLEYNTVRSRLSRGLATIRNRLSPSLVEYRRRRLPRPPEPSS